MLATPKAKPITTPFPNCRPHPDGHVDFVLEEQGKQLTVNYVGRDPLPDTFKDGAQALVEGQVMPDGKFTADQVQAKCASKYEATPGAAPAASQPGQTMNNSSPSASGNKS